MSKLQSVRIALRALRANPLRSALTMLGIVIGVAAVITMVAVGAPFTDGEIGAAAKVAVIGATVAKALFNGADPVGQTIRVANVPIAVAGVLARKGLSGLGRDQDDVVFVPISTARLRLFGEA